MTIEVISASRNCFAWPAQTGTGRESHDLGRAAFALTHAPSRLSVWFMAPQIAVDQQKVADFCRRNHIRRLALFGSVLRSDFRPESDIDVLVEFAPSQRIGLRLIRMQEELSTILGRRKVDLITPKFLNRRIRDQVLSSAEVQYTER
ncbi:MAG TPA: nucleotidyltransferase family protein [Candidatus Baltobacteraceae bacterium]|nr:nucleotidyltransferase family protein [Candidatus Baltobacteraceae bacterium]